MLCVIGGLREFSASFISMMDSLFVPLVNSVKPTVDSFVRLSSLVDFSFQSPNVLGGLVLFSSGLVSFGIPTLLNCPSARRRLPKLSSRLRICLVRVLRAILCQSDSLLATLGSSLASF